jgi:hypothetical protein
VRLRKDHIAGGIFLLVGILVLVASTDLPFGTLASPGAGMLPVMIVGLMMTFGVVILARAGESAPASQIAWDDLPHALRVIVVGVAAAAAYTTLGFAATMPVMLFTLVFVVERRPFLPALAFSLGVPAGAYLLFTWLLKTPLPRGELGF